MDNLYTIPENPANEVLSKCETLKRFKGLIRSSLINKNQIFKNIELIDEWKNATIVVRTKNSWEIFLKALRDLFVEDMESRLNTWGERELYPHLFKELHSIRLRRNYIEHPSSLEGQKEEELCCLRDINKTCPIDDNDWLILQLKTLDRLNETLKITLEQIAKSENLRT